MARRPIPLLLLALALAGCMGTDVGNPDAADRGNGGDGGGPGGTGGAGGSGGTGGTGGAGAGGTGGGAGQGPAVSVAPEAIDFGVLCPGGIARAWIVVENEGETPVDVAIASASGELELSHDELLSLDPAHAAAIWAIAHTTGEMAGSSRSGTIDFTWGGRDEGVTLPWSLEVAEEDFARSQLLCSAHGPCEQLHFGGAAGEAIDVPIQIANDGCADLTLTGFAFAGDGPLPELAEGDLPATVEPGSQWEGVIRFASPSEGTATGEIRLLTDEADPHPPVPWSAEILPERTPPSDAR